MSTVIVRADASAAIGTGHVMRCLALAEALRERGAQVFFVCRAHSGNLSDLIESRGFEVSRLKETTGQAARDATQAHASGLGATWKDDADETRSIVEAMSSPPDWLVIDHYALDDRWEGALRKSVKRIMAIDDLADRAHDCDLLLDQNLVENMETRYTGKIPDSCGQLIGPEYALLHPSYAPLHDASTPSARPVKRVLVFFGGADVSNMTARTVFAFLRLQATRVILDVVLTEGSPHAAGIRELAARHTNIRVHSGLPTLAPLLVEADIAVGAGGATSWERLCLGVPSIVVTLAENQRPIAEALDQRRLVRWLGHHDEVDEIQLAAALDELIAQGVPEDWSRRCLGVVDGRGAARVATALLIGGSTPLTARPVAPDDEALLLKWANDQLTRRNAFSSGPVSAETHHRWFHARLGNEGCRIFIVEAEAGLPIGQVRFEREGDVWRISYTVAPQFRGRGLGRVVLEVALEQLRQEHPAATVLGEVKEANIPSCRIFESLGFQANRNSGVVEYRRAV